jgi:hypothetical protein
LKLAKLSIRRTLSVLRSFSVIGPPVVRDLSFGIYRSGFDWCPAQSRGFIGHRGLTIGLMGGLDFSKHDPREFVIL